MAAPSAGLLLFRRTARGLEVLLVHPGGPFWAAKDLGAWSIPKGQVHPGETLTAAALREFREETGGTIDGPLFALGHVRQGGGKVVHAWATEGTFDPQTLVSNTFDMEWPPRSGQVRRFPEVDRAAWFHLDEARRRILRGQQPLLEALAQALGV